MRKIMAVLVGVLLLGTFSVALEAGQLVRVTWNHGGVAEFPSMLGFKIYVFVDGEEIPALEQDTTIVTGPFEHQFDIGDIITPILFKVEMTAYNALEESARSSSSEFTINPVAPDAPSNVVVVPITP